MMMIQPLPFGGAIPAPAPFSKRKIVHSLPRTEPYVERPEMEHLRRFWRDQPHGGVLLLVGLGGSGKTCLVDRFLDEVPGARTPRVAGAGDLPPANRLLVWSFYRSADCAGAVNAYDLLSAGAGAHERKLVVLDGLEAVQKPRAALGEIVENCPGLRKMLRDCATLPKSCWVIVTTRHSPPDVSGAAMKEVSINDVDLDTARGILRVHGVKANDSELDALVAKTVPHSTWLALVGTALREWHNGAIPDELPWLGEFEGGPQVERLANQLTRLLASYEDKLKEDEVAVLKLIALLGKPVSATEIQPLLKPAMGTECAPPRLHGILGRLAALLLIERRSRVSGEWEYSAHPLVLQHFHTAWMEDRWTEETSEAGVGSEARRDLTLSRSKAHRGLNVFWIEDLWQENKGVQILSFVSPISLSTKELDDLHQAMFFSMYNRLDKASAILQRLRHEHPDERIVLYNLGHVYQWQGLVGEALAIFDHVLELDPGDAYAFSALARLLRSHPELITDVFGDARRVEIEAKPTWAGIGHIIPLINGRNAAAACRIDPSLINALKTGPVWYWWQMVETNDGPVVRLYVEFDYQPHKFHYVMQPLNIADPHVGEWLYQLEQQDSFTIMCFEDNRIFRFARQLNHTIEQRERLRDLHRRAAMAGKGITASETFEQAIREAEARWEERLKPGRQDWNEEGH